MIKNDIVNAVAEAAGVPHVKATQAVETIIAVMLQSLVRGYRIELRGFGVFSVRPRKKGVGRNPKRPSEVVQIPPGFTIRFKPGKALHDVPDSKETAPAEHDATPKR